MQNGGGHYSILVDRNRHWDRAGNMGSALEAGQAAGATSQGEPLHGLWVRPACDARSMSGVRNRESYAEGDLGGRGVNAGRGTCLGAKGKRKWGSPASLRQAPSHSPIL
jgi:hypothetical protein